MTQTSAVTGEPETEVRLVQIERPADDVVLLTLADPTGAPLPAWAAGAHIDLVISDDLVRQYSLCGSPSDTSAYQVAVLRSAEGTGGSVAVHALAEGATVRIRGPRNHFPLLPSPRYIFVAGGIGITPMLPMIEAAEAAGAEWVLHYGGRSRGSMAFLDRLAGYGERVVVVPQDEQGILDLASIVGTPAPDTLVYCCGPEPLLAAMEEQCAAWPGHPLHLERFAPKPHEDGPNTEFDLVLERSGMTLRVPADQTVFATMRQAGVNVLGSCLEGICGTCEQTVLEGEVDHRDSVLDAEEQAANESMMVCVSRALSDRLVLDA